MTSGSLTLGAELDEGPDGSDTMPFPKENAVLMVHGGDRAYMSTTPIHPAWRGNKEGEPQCPRFQQSDLNKPAA
jgi:hypothetical protein